MGRMSAPKAAHKFRLRRRWAINAHVDISAGSRMWTYAANASPSRLYQRARQPPTAVVRHYEAFADDEATYYAAFRRKLAAQLRPPHYGAAMTRASR